MEREIGEVFDYNGVLLKVVKLKSNKKSCDGCYFDGVLRVRDDEITGPCSDIYRRDNANVIFKKQHE